MEIELIRDYASAYASMTDAKAKELVERLFDLEEQQHAVTKEYFGKVEAAVGAGVAARFVQVERRINTLLDLQMAADIPLLEPPRSR